MSESLSESELAIVDELQRGGKPAQAQFFNEHREVLKQMTKFRLDRRLKRRLDDSDILQDAYIEYCDRIDRYLVQPIIPPVVWLRRLVRQVISRLNRDHVGTQCRDLRRETYEYSSSAVNIAQLSASLSSIGSSLKQIELREKLIGIVSSMSPLEREILTLVHFEERTIREAAIELNINIEAAKKRYRRALNRLREIHESNLQGFCE
jgi:RNA polymerase sigma-70 factor, ECF subfamily